MLLRVELRGQHPPPTYSIELSADACTWAIVVVEQPLSLLGRVVVSQLLDNRSIGEPEQVELGLRFQRPRHPGRHDE